MLSLVLALSLSQLVMWTDSDGVVHVDEPHRAPAKAKPLSGDGYSRIDDDARPLVMPDGGTREQDSAWWRQRFAAARATFAAAAAREEDASASIRSATREVCVTATASATSTVGVFPVRGKTVVVGNQSAVQVRRGQGVQLSNTATSSASRCASGVATEAQRESLRAARADRLEAARVLAELETEARRASVPLRYWR